MKEVPHRKIPIWVLSAKRTTTFAPYFRVSIRQHHFAFIAILPWYCMPSLYFGFRDLDMAAVHLSAIVGTLTGSGLHRIVYYFERDKVNQNAI